MNVLIVGANRYPRGDAGALREEAFARMMSSMGHGVRVVGLGKSTGFTWAKFNDTSYISLRAKNEDVISRWLNRTQYYNRLNKYVLGRDRYDVILITNGSNHTIINLKTYAIQNGIKLIHDSVEWYSSEQFRMRVLSKSYRNKNKLNTRIIDNNFSVIAISTYLMNYYVSKGIRTARIPVILDGVNYQIQKKNDNKKIIFIYAGMPGKKDYLSIIIKGFLLLDNDEKKKCELKIVGVTKEQLVKRCGVTRQETEDMGDVLQCVGRISHQEVQELFEYADFSVFLRDSNARYAKAGFPTKYVESMAFATPVICNLSSDLGLYAKNNYNTIICSECSSEAMTICIRKAINMTKEERKMMQSNARRTFEQEFDSNHYINEMKKILS